MRYTIILTVVSFLGFTAHASAQTIVPNDGFEQWSLDSFPKSSADPSGTAFHPVGWGGGTFGDNMGDTSRTIFRSTDAHTGLYALGGKVLTEDTLGPFVRTTSWYSMDSLTFPLVGSPSALEGWYKFKSVGNDFINIIPFFDNSALAFFNITTTESTYTHFSIPLPNRGDSGSGIIEIRVGNTSGNLHQGTEFVIDDLAFTGFASVPATNVIAFGLEQNYPNPFEKTTTIRYALPADCDNITLELLNLLGERIALLKDGQDSQGEHQIFLNGDRFASGTYYLRITLGTGEVRTMKLVKN